MLRIVSRRLLLWSNVCLLTGLLLSAYLPYLNPARCWITGFSGFFFPVLFPLCILFIICWTVFKKWKYLAINIIGMACCIPAALSTWGVHIFHNNILPKEKAPNQFTLMTYNTSSMGLERYVTDKDKEAVIYEAIAAGSPAILCMQEFYSNDNPEKEQHIQRIKTEGRYPYHYFTCDKTHWESWYYGIALFSRYPIAAATAIQCGESKAGSGSTFLQADLVVAGDTIRVFSVQLTSYMFRGEDYVHMKAPKGTGLIGKMRRTFETRAAQALQLAALVAESPYPTVVCGDFNDTPVSFTYKTISSNMRDVFLETGAGWGRTLSYLSPTLRIDYILAQPSINVHGSKVFPVSPSEHFPVMACLSLKKN